ncbi:hypothetical protein PS623_04729 [Pseudomonas fluorescens]|uniref:hypothetical protein n=1 Tax=Pseudomonas fluorescens TaxID=294 RepID=UPI001241B629|nr:hypothetical protein [Pseudomonas fluorescens]VVN29930.1 hypothetical protein PS623_04729 [Pseudomonas fluorescens]
MVEQEQGTGITVEALAPEYQAQAQQWAVQLGLPLNDDSAAVALQIGADFLQLQQLPVQAPRPLSRDFAHCHPPYSRLFVGRSGQLHPNALYVR